MTQKKLSDYYLSDLQRLKTERNRILACSIVSLILLGAGNFFFYKDGYQKHSLSDGQITTSEGKYKVSQKARYLQGNQVFQEYTSSFKAPKIKQELLGKEKIDALSKDTDINIQLMYFGSKDLDSNYVNLNYAKIEKIAYTIKLIHDILKTKLVPDLTIDITPITETIYAGGVDNKSKMFLINLSDYNIDTLIHELLHVLNIDLGLDESLVSNTFSTDSIFKILYLHPELKNVEGFYNLRLSIFSNLDPYFYTFTENGANSEYISMLFESKLDLLKNESTERVSDVDLARILALYKYGYTSDYPLGKPEFFSALLKTDNLEINKVNYPEILRQTQIQVEKANPKFDHLRTLIQIEFQRIPALKKNIDENVILTTDPPKFPSQIKQANFVFEVKQSLNTSKLFFIVLEIILALKIGKSYLNLINKLKSLSSTEKKKLKSFIDSEMLNFGSFNKQKLAEISKILE